MNPQYRINVKGGTEAQNQKWSKELSTIMTHVEGMNQKRKSEYLANFNARMISEAIASKRR